ncbi:hypothetical protein QJS04_geneDACA001392 [Acorus gramineus]|uniref:Metallothionein n=1 Tax=Acorus gramineus TaxID=55184 RepID=A0AAV9AAU0_ACOGR|nr:hypothetical protein QJS04_geneDACA001392 [Acorus gramineus]
MNKEKEKMADKGGVGTTIDAEKMADKGGVGTTTGTGGGCNEPCGCPTPCDGGNTCRCTGGSEAEHAVCKCGENCSCNPCTCEKVATVGKASCQCGSGCGCGCGSACSASA